MSVPTAIVTSFVPPPFSRPGSPRRMRVRLEDAGTETLVEGLMGRRPELRYQYITENAAFVRELEI